MPNILKDVFDFNHGSKVFFLYTVDHYILNKYNRDKNNKYSKSR